MCEEQKKEEVEGNSGGFIDLDDNKDGLFPATLLVFVCLFV